MSKLSVKKEKNNGIHVNQIEIEKEVKRIKQLLDDLLDFLAEIPVDKYHDYREFRNLRLREYLLQRYMKEKYMCEFPR